jgi:membrane protein involved in colicin uptake
MWNHPSDVSGLGARKAQRLPVCPPRKWAAIKEEAQRQAKAAADAEAKLNAAEAEQQRLRDEVQRQTKAAADADAKSKAAEAEQQRQAKAAADAEAKLKAATTPTSTTGLFTIQTNTVISGHGSTTGGTPKSVTSLAECERECAMASCKGFNYLKDNRLCIAYPESRGSTSDEKYDSGIRK